MITNSPLVSVLMPVYNAETYLKESLASLLSQDYTHLEIIIVDDGCTDQSVELIQSFKDPRIVLITNQSNIGLAASLNKAIAVASGEFLARMDADDIALPARIARQVQYMLDHPDVDVLGTAMQYIGDSNYLNFFPVTHEACRSYLLFNVCFGHPSVMFRRRVFDHPDNFYNPEYRQYSEEYDLWCRLADRCRFHNLADVLLYYRTYPVQIKSEAENNRKRNSSHIRKQYLMRYFGEIQPADWQAHLTGCFVNLPASLNDIREVDRWFLKLNELNKEKKAFDAGILELQLAERFFEVCYTYSRLMNNTLLLFYRSYWSTVFKPDLKKTVKFAIKTCKLL